MLIEENTMKFYDLRKRTIAMVISWRIIGGGITATIVYTLSKWGLSSAELASTIFIWTLTINGVAFYIHDRVWNMFGWGRTIKENS
jgi:uncharacterized membrane protein